MKYFIQTAALTVLLAIVSATFFSVNPSDARVKISERTKYYSVSGKNGKQLFRSISRKGRKLKNGDHAIASTQMTVKIRNLKTKVRGRRCVVRRVDVVVKMIYTYPRWHRNKRAPKKVRRNWAKFMKLVRKHEAHHGRINRQYAKALERQIKSTSGRVSKGCKDFGRGSIRKFKRLQRKFDRKHRRFDSREARASARVRRLQRALLASF